MTQADGALDAGIATETGNGRFQVMISTGGVQFLADEPEDVGGLGSGPTPYQILASALAACTTMTLRLYADRKGWDISDLRTSVGHYREDGNVQPDVFVRRISFTGELDAEQREHLIDIADRCPVHNTLRGGVRIETRLGDALPKAAPSTTHMVDMEALIDVGRGSYDFTQR